MTSTLATPRKHQPGVKPCGNPDCHRHMRPTKTKAADYPGTVSYGADGQCSMCYRAKLAAQQAEAQDLKHQSNMAQAAAFVAVRRRRGVPPEGLRYECRLEDEAA